MSRIYLIRHARPAAVWGGGDDDPGLDEAGRAQAAMAADWLMALAPAERPKRVASSPLRRCQETAQPFAHAIGAPVELAPAVGEIPTPAGLAPDARGAWLRTVFRSDWSKIEGDIDYEGWRRAVAQAVEARPGYAIFSHFVAINAVVSLLCGQTGVLSFQPDHASVTVLEAAPQGLRLIVRGPEGATSIL
jgi:broad specificity phosphatase PhoE